LTLFDIYANPNDSPTGESDWQRWQLYQSIILRTGEVLKMAKADPSVDEHAAKRSVFSRLIKSIGGSVSGGAKDTAIYVAKKTVEATALALIPLAHRNHYFALKKKFTGKSSIKTKAILLGLDAATTSSGVPNVPGFVNRQFQQFTASALPKARSGLLQLFSPLVNKLSEENRLQALLPDLHTAMVEGSKEGFETIPAVPRSFKELKEYFYQYYSIALGEQGEEKREKLKHGLLILKGGWNEDSALLIHYLNFALQRPVNTSPSTNAVGEFVRDLNVWKLPHSSRLLDSLKEPEYSADGIGIGESEYIGFFNDLSSQFRTLQMIQGAADMVIPNIGTGLFMFGGVVPQIPTKIMLGIQWAASLGKAAYAHLSSPAATVAEPPKERASSFSENFDEIDVEADEKFNELFKSAFTTEIVEPVQGPAMGFNTEGESPLHAEGLARVNRSQQDYHALTQKPKSYLRIKEGAIWPLYLRLALYRDSWNADMNKEKEKLLKLINENPSMHKGTVPLTWEDLERFYIKGDFSALQKAANLPPDAIPHLEKSISILIIKTTRFHQLERALKLTQQLSAMDLGTPAAQTLLEDLGKVLQSKRAYTFKVPENMASAKYLRLVRHCLLFEYQFGGLLWGKQTERLKTLLLSGDENAMIELIMGLGKTDALIPIATGYVADGSQAVVNIWPSSLIQTNVSQGAKRNGKMFHQIIHSLRFNRSVPMDVANLEAMIGLFNHAKESGDSLNMTKQDAQALQLIFIEKLYELDNRGIFDYDHDESNKKAELLAELLQFLRTNAKFIVDEVHETCSDKDELCFPLGDASTVSFENYQMMEKCFSILSQEIDLKEFLHSTELTEEKVKKLREDLIPKVAEKLSKLRFFKLHSKKQRAEFVAYVTGKAETIPRWLLQHKNHTEFAMIKGMLSPVGLVSHAFSIKIGESYGTEDVNKDNAIASPYDGNTSPIAHASIRNPYEALVKTMMIYQHSGLKESQVSSLVKKLKEDAEKEAEFKKIPIEKTEADRFYKYLCKSCNISNDDLKNPDPTALKAFENHPDAILRFVRLFVYKNVKFWVNNTSSDSQNFASQAKSAYSDTGTPYNYETLPAGTKMHWDQGTVGEALAISRLKCPDSHVHLLEDGTPTQILQNVLEEYFSAGQDYTALIDGGAQLLGLSNEAVAKAMREYVKAHRPDIKAINFFQKDDQGNDLLMSWGVDSDKPMLHANSRIPLEAQLSYFDQRHGFGANIPQKHNAKGLNLIGPTHNLYRLLQELFRMRGLKVFKSLLNGEEMKPEALEASNLTETQTVHLAMTRKTKEKITGIAGDTPPTFNEVIKFCIKNEMEFISKQNFSAYSKQVKNVVRQKVMDKLTAASSSSSQMLSIFRAYKDVLVNKMQIDPRILYGMISIEVDTLDILPLLHKQALQKIKDTEFFTAEEVEGIEAQIKALPIPLLPEKTHAFSNGSETVLDQNEVEQLVHNTLNTEQNQEAETETENEQEAQRETNTAINTQLSPISRRSKSYKEWEWPQDIEKNPLEWLKFNLPRKNFFEKPEMDINFALMPTEVTDVVPPLFTFRNVIATASNKALASIAHAFDERLWFSNNFIPRINKGWNETIVEPGSAHQRNLFEVLVHYKEKEDGTYEIMNVGCLSQKDAGFWKGKLSSEPSSASAGETKVMLYDISSQCPVAGDAISAEQMTEFKKSIEPLEVQLKFMEGVGDYEDDQIKLLMEWINRYPIKQMEDAFTHIFRQRHSEKNYEGTSMKLIFKQLGNPDEAYDSDLPVEDIDELDSEEELMPVEEEVASESVATPEESVEVEIEDDSEKGAMFDPFSFIWRSLRPVEDDED